MTWNFKFQLKLIFVATQSKLLLTARWIFQSFPSATLIRLYEFLKNSLLINLCRPTTKQSATLANCFVVDPFDQPNESPTWWRMTGSNRRPPACKAGALPAELIPHWVSRIGSLVGLVGLEPTTPALSRRCSNQLSYRPQPSNLFWSSMGHPTTDKCGYLAANSCLHFPERR